MLAQTGPLRPGDLASSPSIKFGTRTIHFQHPDEVKQIEDRHRRDGWRFIGDGESDQYDWGNYISTSVCGGDRVLEAAATSDSFNWAPDSTGGYIYYRMDDTCAVSSPCFGPESTYRMNITQHATGQHLFHMRASVTTDDPEFFFIVSGNLGADGRGNSENHTLVSNDGQYVGFAWQTCNGPSSTNDKSDVVGDDDDVNDVSVNHLVIVKNGPHTHQRVSIPGDMPGVDYDTPYWRGTWGLDQYYQGMYAVYPVCRDDGTIRQSAPFCFRMDTLDRC